MQDRAAAEVLSVLQQQSALFKSVHNIQAADQGSEGQLDQEGETVLEVWKGLSNSAVLPQGQMSDLQSDASGSAARGERQTREASPRSQSAGDVLPRSCQEGWKRTAENGKGVPIQWQQEDGDLRHLGCRF